MEAKTKEQAIKEYTRKQGFLVCPEIPDFRHGAESKKW
jgi:hypothetical protein